MFPRVALIIVGVLVVLIGTVVVIGQMEAREAHHVSACERGIARPYLQLMTYMRELAEAGRFDELRKVIIQAQERSSDIGRACREESENIYWSQVDDLTKKSNQSLQPTAGPSTAPRHDD